MDFQWGRFFLASTGALYLFSFIAPAAISKTPEDLEPIASFWGLSPLRPALQHRHEGLERKDSKHLEARVWYEDYSVRTATPSSKNLLCRFAYTFVYGRDRPRSKVTTPALERVFSALPDVQSVKLTFFTVTYTNKPFPPRENSKLRVVWQREEKITPYLSASLTRKEWETLRARLRNYVDRDYETFKAEACDTTLSGFLNLRSDFKALKAISETSDE